jgi:beta-lactamase regulating signal transducer with metallopeptidase domain
MADWAGLAGAMRGAGPALENHLWQSTVFAGVAAGLALALKKNQARARYWIWMSASVKLLLPFALLAGVASHFVKPKATPAFHTGVVAAVESVSEPFQGQVQGSRFEVRGTAEANPPKQSLDGAPNFVDPARDDEAVTNGAPKVAAPRISMEVVREWAPVVLGGTWLAGFVTVLVAWMARWRRVARAMRAAAVVREGREVGALRRIEDEAGLRARIEVRMSSAAMEPGVFGIVRPVLAWPARISGRLDDAHLEAVLAHEVCHVRRRDNLTAALHMLVQAVFWFHPMVWWMGARLVEERERACDEEVLELFGRPEAYAESILKVCEFCVASPRECVAGVTGADLKKRVVEIMTGRVVRKLTWGKKLLLVGVGLCVAAVPIVLGQAKAARRMMEAAIAAAPEPLKGPVRFAARELIAEESTPYTGLIAEVQADGANPPKQSLDGAPNAVAGAAEYVPTMTFDVASVRESKLDLNLPHRVGGSFSPHSTNLRMENVQLYYLLSMAYGVDVHQQEGLPDWGWTSYNIEAKSDSAADEKLANLPDADAKAEREHMLQVLLAERFKLKVHWDTRVEAATGGLDACAAGRAEVAWRFEGAAAASSAGRWTARV